jgi:serine/threonine-protein phosphatase 2A regulatory subunit B'
MPGRLTNRRAAIRKIFNHVFAREIYEPMPAYRGISEILDILASIINGFACPIKDEHKRMLYHYLIPLHKLADEHM